MELIDVGRAVLKAGIHFAGGIGVSLIAQAAGVLAGIYAPVPKAPTAYLLATALVGLWLTGNIAVRQPREEAEEHLIEFVLTVPLPMLFGLVLGVDLVVVYFGDTLTALLS